MQPGDLYAPPPGSNPNNHNDPYAAPPPSQSYTAYPPAGPPGYQNNGQNANPFSHPSDNAPPPVPPPPQGYGQMSGGYNNEPAPYGLGDNRLTSPPPLHPSTSNVSLGYPPRHQESPYRPLQDDMYDDSPLLNHARPDPSFNIGPLPQAYQLSDNGATKPPVGGGVGGSVGGGVGGSVGGGGRIQFEQPYGDGGLNEDGRNNLHYGPLPARMVRRNKTTKKVALFRGHLVLEIDVPSRLLEKCARKDGKEFTKLRYTAVTCDPDEFVHDKYALRQQLYEPTRKTELFIVITMYNEDDLLFCRTMRGIMQNIAHLCTRSRSKTWGDEGWTKVVVCIVADGRSKINDRTRSALAALGVYQEGVAKNVVNGKPVTAHVYEYTTQLGINSKGDIVPGGDKFVPIQLLFCLKEKNQKKINSHRWFFNAFGASLDPNVCVLLDAGTQPGPTSIYHVWKAFDLNSSVGGACGEIVALPGRFWKNLANPLVAAQNFEYKMSNILDKQFESLFGYISVLPGAFSAYRYIALQNDATGQGPLEKYFYGEKMHGAGAGIFKANMYLAEDRILCWELVSKRDSKWTLHYVKSAKATTDVPTEVPELVSQRRRWLNGSFFAAVHSIAHFHYLYRSSHSIFRMAGLHIELLYQIFNNVFAWFALGNFYITFIVLINAMTQPDADGNTAPFVYTVLATVLKYLYLALLLVCFVLSLGNRPAGSKVGYMISMVGFALITVYMLYASIMLAVRGVQTFEESGGNIAQVVDLSNDQGRQFTNILVALASTYGIYVISCLFALDPWHLITSFVQYLLIAPSYINVLNVYAFSNVHDVSWGTKGSDKVSEDLGVVKSDGKGGEVTVEVPVEQQDIDAVYEAELRTLATKVEEVASAPSADQQQEDYYKNFRTNVLLAWTLSNAGLAMAILSITHNGQGISVQYMIGVLYAVAALSFVRFFGATLYLIIRLFMGE